MEALANPRETLAGKEKIDTYPKKNGIGIIYLGRKEGPMSTD